MATLEDKLVYLSNKIKAYGIAAGDEEAFNIIVEAIELIQCLSKKKNNWWPHAGAGSWNKLDSITAEHLSQCKIDCEYCCGTGQIAVTVSVDSKTRESQFGYSKCRKCDGRGYL